ncbi:hypothetical protein EMCRGX_G010857 [Ephydatia muelleri]
MFVPCRDYTASLEGYRIIFPCVSVGNVPQLAVDLIINTLRLSRAGYLRHPGLLPLVGNDAFDHLKSPGHLHLSTEVYCSHELKLAVIQMRVPTCKGIPEAERRDSQILGRPLRFMVNQLSLPLYDHFANNLKWCSLEPRGGIATGSMTGSGEAQMKLLSDEEMFLPCAGIAKRLHLMSTQWDVKQVTLIAFCSQGDNIADSIGLASYLNEWLHLQENSVSPGWACPKSWGLIKLFSFLSGVSLYQSDYTCSY